MPIGVYPRPSPEKALRASSMTKDPHLTAYEQEFEAGGFDPYEDGTDYRSRIDDHEASRMGAVAVICGALLGVIFIAGMMIGGEG